VDPVPLTVSDKPCSELSSQGFKFRKSAPVCSQSNLGECQTESATFATSVDFCQATGARLCTATELTAGVTAGSGCGNDYRLVWSSTPCTGGFYTTMGKGGSELTCSSTDLSLSTRCCADVEDVPVPTVSAKSCDDLSDLKFKFRSSADVCAQSDLDPTPTSACITRKGSGTGADFKGALGFCTAVGARLCSAEELEDGVAKGTGCSNDNRNVWSATKCTSADGKGYFSVAGSGASSTRTCASGTRLLSARCCADVVAAAKSGSMAVDDDSSLGHSDNSTNDVANQTSLIVALSVVAMIALIIVVAIVRKYRLTPRLAKVEAMSTTTNIAFSVDEAAC